MERINEKLKKDIIQGTSSAENNALNSLQECRELIASSSVIDEALIEQIKAQRQKTLEQLKRNTQSLDVFKNVTQEQQFLQHLFQPQLQTSLPQL